MFTPHDAYIVALRPDGAVVHGDLADPTCIPIPIVEFEYDEIWYILINHDDGIWEIINHPLRDDCLVPVQDRLHTCAEATLQHFTQKLLEGPCSDILKRRLISAMGRDIQQEIDQDIINDLRRVLPEIKLKTETVEVKAHTRKLKATWTMESSAPRDPVSIGRSRRQFTAPPLPATLY